MKQDPRFPSLSIPNHPLTQHKLTHMRGKNMSTCMFRELLREITLLIGYEITRSPPLTSRHTGTPIGPMEVPVVVGCKLAVMSVLRTDVDMSDRLVGLIPSARIGHIGVYHDDQRRPAEYLMRLPDLEDRTFILCDPIVVIGYSAAHVADVMKKHGVSDESILSLTSVATPEGMGVFQKVYPGVKLFAALLDSHLDENAYIIPGLDDAGDHLFDMKN